jgi:hypothetical protein
MARSDPPKTLPPFLVPLAADPAGATLGLGWLLDAAEGRRRAQETAEAYAGEGSALVPLPPPARAAAQKMLAGMTVVATGPKMPGRVASSSVESLLLLDTKRPDELLLALSADYPPFLWIPAGTTVESIRAALRGYFPVEQPARGRLHRIARYFIGNEAIHGAYIHGVENHYVASPFTADLTWGSAYPEDPWPARVDVDPSTLDFMAEVRDRARQGGGGVYTTSFRLQHSRGILTLEDHGGLFVVEIRYAPSPNREVIVALNRWFGFAFPPDMPVDGVAALLGLPLQTETQLKDVLADHELVEDHELCLHALAALKYGDLSLTTDLRPFLRLELKPPPKPDSQRAPSIPPPPSVLASGRDLARDLGLDALLIKTAALTSEIDVLQELDRALGGTPPRGWDGPHGPGLLIAGDAVLRPSIDWIWGDRGWTLIDEVPRGEAQIFQRRWRTADGAATVTYGEDHRLGLRFFAVEGEEPAALRARLGNAVALDDVEAVLTAAESAADRSERVGALHKIARLSPEKADPRWLSILERGLAHESPAVRAASLLSAAWIAWPELIPVIETHLSPGLEDQAARAVVWIRHRSDTAA